tara:strand:- start:49 stop:186 length:138 start_codon:yes stop_codon:yes gene_type:complete
MKVSWDRKTERKERFHKKTVGKSKSRNKKYKKENLKYKEDIKENE